MRLPADTTIPDKTRLLSMPWGRGWSLTFLCAVIIMGASDLGAQVEPFGFANRGANAVRTGQAPRMDGTLDDPIWGTAEVISDFRQREPLETQPATEKTDVRI